MPADLVIASWVSDHEQELTALLSIALAILLSWIVGRALGRRAERVAAAVAGGRLSPVADTRLRFLRRLITATILVIGGAIAISQFSALDKLAASLLASSAIAAAVLGFAARQTLANVIAGVMLAIAQPLRVGDEIHFEGNDGVVDDVTLIYTYLRTGEGQRVLIPNERLAGGILRNDTVLEPLVSPSASLWLPLGSDHSAALAALEQVPASTARIAEATVEGVRFELVGDRAAPHERQDRESALLAEGLRALREAGLLDRRPGEQL